ncbi:hypothetical protein [Nostoc sp.]|uniref:hypothetical protein n=1 Tax=Nostoc sp. TaxID=1180 RepID=UPI002FF95EEE
MNASRSPSLSISTKTGSLAYALRGLVIVRIFLNPKGLAIGASKLGVAIFCSLDSIEKMVLLSCVTEGGLRCAMIAPDETAPCFYPPVTRHQSPVAAAANLSLCGELP